MRDNARCPDCGHTEIGKGKLSGYATLTPKGKIFSMGSAIIADVCTNCGYIIKMRVERPEKFKDR
ncbi:MAG: transcription initiation factor TFIIIB [Desulfitobacteriaceae bacterium]|nr:transcription initiation factor TFIIIB [Clostridia bacterium]MDD4346780.1 transcription initiation factor TFIIIB [Desulfitobacteriaceae bacterium]MDD4403072.1 transcription initiation factor TFIIIB [Desulfitobacteriaceae bacterium]